MNETLKTPPVQTGDVLELDIETLNSSGDGLARVNGFTIFVPHALPGDRISARVVKVTPRWASAEAGERLADSPDRIAPPCPVFPECGGCRLQDYDYARQLEFKARVVEDAFRHIGHRELGVPLEIMGAERQYHYRNKASFALHHEKRKLSIGFFRHGSHEVVDSPVCDTLVEPINQVKEWFRSLLNRHGLSIYSESRHQGFLRGLVVRHSVATQQTLVGLITTRGIFKKGFLPDLTQEDTLKHFGICGIVQNFNSKRTNLLLGPKNRPLWGRDFMEESLGGLKYRVSLASFFQVNPFQAEQLYSRVAQWVQGTDGLVVDAYCGNGGISFWLAKAGHRVLGIDECKPAIEDAKVGAEWNQLKHCRFLEGTLEGRLSELKKGERVNTLIVDPPRKGLSKEVLNAIPELNPRHLIYVSCNPATLARDVATLSNYEVKDALMIDMFPQTQHVETALRLERK